MSHGARVERVVEASPARVWRALTEPSALAAWYWPPSFGMEVTFEAVAGGSFRIASARGMAVSGRVVAVEAPRLLELAWRWEGEELETSVVVELAAEGPDRTRVSVEHAGFPTEEAASDHATGWTDCLARLPGYLAG